MAGVWGAIQQQESTTTTSADGAFDWWFDGFASDVDYPDGFNVSEFGNPYTINSLVLGNNHNKSLQADMFYKWGHVKVWWTNNPGWV